MAAILGFVSGFAIAMANGRDALAALGDALVFALLVSAIVAVLAWASETAARKGYSPWLGVLAVVLLNVFGVALLLWLPVRRKAAR